MGCRQRHTGGIIDCGRRQKAGKRIGSGRMEEAVGRAIGLRQKNRGMSRTQVRTLNMSRNPAARQKAIAFANAMLRQYPDRSDVNILYARVCMVTWVDSRKRIDAEAAVAAYRHYIEVAPSNNDAARGYAQDAVNFIQQRQAQYDNSKGY